MRQRAGVRTMHARVRVEEKSERKKTLIACTRPANRQHISEFELSSKAGGPRTCCIQHLLPVIGPNQWKFHDAVPVPQATHDVLFSVAQLANLRVCAMQHPWPANQRCIQLPKSTCMHWPLDSSPSSCSSSSKSWSFVSLGLTLRLEAENDQQCLAFTILQSSSLAASTSKCLSNAFPFPIVVPFAFQPNVDPNIR